MRHPHMSSGGRYPVLRTIAILWLVTAVLSLVAGVYQAISASPATPRISGSTSAAATGAAA